MSLKHALLGYLNYKGMTGYDLKQCFDQSIKYFWNANLSQIYPTLNQMEQDGLLTMQVEYQEDRPNRKVYHITGAGREELQRWLREPAEPSPLRLAFLIKVFFGGNLRKEEMLTLLRHDLESHRKVLSMYEGPVKQALAERIEKTGQRREGFFWGLPLEMGIENERAWVQWLEETIEKVEETEE